MLVYALMYAPDDGGELIGVYATRALAEAALDARCAYTVTVRRLAEPHTLYYDRRPHWYGAFDAAGELVTVGTDEAHAREKAAAYMASHRDDHDILEQIVHGA